MTALSCAALLVAGCSDRFFSGDAEVARGVIGYVPGALGVLAVDEPQAALIGRDILSSGGSAADAAVAMAFTLTVTMPSAAGIGGGGVCIVRDQEKGLPEVVDFLPRAPQSVPAGTERPSAVPGVPRGLFLLQSRYGLLTWDQVVTPAENLARFGYAAPRAFTTELAKVWDALAPDAAAARLFGKAGGGPVGEGDFIVQTALAASLGRLRNQGVGDFYIGNDARNLVEAVTAAGGSLTLSDLRDYRPELRRPLSFKWEKNAVWHFAGPPSAGGAVAAEMTAILLADRRYERADPLQRSHLLAEAAKRAFAHRMAEMRADGTYAGDPRRYLEPAAAEAANEAIPDDGTVPLTSLIASPVAWPETPSAVSLAVMDSMGGAVACNLTMNNSFGTGRVLPSFGMLLAAAPDSRGRTYTPLGPALLTNELINQAYMAIAASGGTAAPTGMLNVLARVAAGPETLRQSMQAPRLHYGGVPDQVFVEPEMPDNLVDGLKALGHQVAKTPSIGRVAAVYCRSGIPTKEEPQCESATDPRGHGVAIGGN